MAVRYEVVEAGDIAASHNPVAGFEKNMAYTLENERTYHSSVADRRKVLEQAQDLKPTLLMAAPDANQGAPVVDHQGNVLGGNGFFFTCNASVRTNDAATVKSRDCQESSETAIAPIPCNAPSIAALTVPEYSTSVPRFGP